jgi:hypothetical protein
LPTSAARRGRSALRPRDGRRSSRGGRRSSEPWYPRSRTEPLAQVRVGPFL